MLSNTVVQYNPRPTIAKWLTMRAHHPKTSESSLKAEIQVMKDLIDAFKPTQ